MRVPRIYIFTVGIFLAIQVASGASQTVRYSWPGRLVASGTDDPWQIGDHGQDFELHVVVSRGAPDIFDLNVEFAGHEIRDARLVLHGVDIPFVGDGTIDFTDNGIGGFDLVAFHGEFSRFGHIVEIGSLAVLPMTTFSFSRLIEPPPLFVSSAIASIDQAACCGGQYSSLVEAGAQVIAVPEPGSLALCALCTLVCGAVCFTTMKLFDSSYTVYLGKS